MFQLVMIALQAAVPLTNPALWSSGAVYPANALRNADEGIVGYELYVDLSGTVTDCKILKSSGVASLDAATCPHLSKVARFSRADKSDEPIRRYRGDLTWRIGAGSPIRQMTMLVNALPAAEIDTYTDVAFTVTTSGRVTDCRIVQSSGSSDLDHKACSSLTEKPRFNPVPTPLIDRMFRINWQEEKAR